MKSLPARRIMSACILSAATAAVLAVPGTASASIGTQCSGENITGQGSSLQKVAQQTVWTPDFNTSTDKLACAGKQGDKKKPTVVYNSTGSGAGLRSFGAEDKSPSEISFGVGNAYVGTDEPPNAAQIAEIEKNESTPTKNTVETIPVAQESVAIIVHLPSGCTATSTAASGRLAISDATLQGIFAGTLKTWGEIKDGGDAITGTGCAADPIVPVVRFDQSGTTHIFKRYLGLINTAKLLTETEANETWDELSEGSQNVVWPKAADVVKPAVKGGGEEIAKVAGTAGSVGYVNLAEARANSAFVPPSGGANEPTFWAVVENGVKGKGKSLKVTYADPATNGEVATLGNANCAKTAYTNGSKPFPPPSVFQPWNEVTTAVPGGAQELVEKDYSLCGMTYDLAFTSYSLLPGTSEAEATTVNDFLRFVVGKSEGQKLIDESDYLALPKGEVLPDAEEGASKVGF
jgi:ABC-type phosphate transport system substrate-binding protein